jgi:hypothetical protein
MVLWGVVSCAAGETQGPGDADGADSSARADRAPRCDGIATPCELFDMASCPNEVGCFIGGTCSGLAHDCFSISDNFDCIGQDGCTWSGSSCYGTASRCDELTAEYPCIYQHGCSWTPGCSGTPFECNSVEVDVWEKEVQTDSEMSSKIAQPASS